MVTSVKFAGRLKHDAFDRCDRWKEIEPVSIYPSAVAGIGQIPEVWFPYNFSASDLSDPSKDQDNSIEIHQMGDSTETLHQSTAIVLLFCNIMIFFNWLNLALHK